MKSKFKYYLLPIIYVILIYTLILIFGYTSQRIITSNQNHYESSVSDEISRDLKLRLNEYVSKIEAMEEFANKSKVLGINYDDFYLFFFLIIASYHGIPKEYFDKGDPYQCYCQKTTSWYSKSYKYGIRHKASSCLEVERPFWS